MTQRIGYALAIICWALCASVSAQTQPLHIGDASDHFQLVHGLTEISGLAVATENSVYAHNDEHGIVYEIDLAGGDIVKAFALGDPTVRADFEGVAAVEGRIYLVTSAGLIYEAMIGAHRARVRYNIFDTGAGEFCEVEGIAPGPAPKGFLLMCKTSHQEALDGRLVVFNWSLADRIPVRDPWLNISLSEFLTVQERWKFRPSAIEWRAADNSILILSARNHLLLNLRRDGSLLFKKALAPEIHPQAEGVAMMPSGDLVIADEGTARMPGLLTIYQAEK